MKSKAKEIILFVLGILVGTLLSWFASIYVFQRFILQGQQSSMGFEYIPVIFGTPVLAALIFGGLFVTMNNRNLLLRLLVSVSVPVVVNILAIVVLYKLVFDY